MSKGRQELESLIKVNKSSILAILYKLPLTGNELRVLMCILNDTEEYNSSQQEMADKTGMPYNSVGKSYRSLVKQGFLEIVRRGREGSKAEIAVGAEIARYLSPVATQEGSSKPVPTYSAPSSDPNSSQYLPIQLPVATQEGQLTYKALKKATEESTEEIFIGPSPSVQSNKETEIKQAPKQKKIPEGLSPISNLNSLSKKELKDEILRVQSRLQPRANITHDYFAKGYTFEYIEKIKDLIEIPTLN